MQIELIENNSAHIFFLSWGSFVTLLFHLPHNLATPQSHKAPRHAICMMQMQSVRAKHVASAPFSACAFCVFFSCSLLKHFFRWASQSEHVPLFSECLTKLSCEVVRFYHDPNIEHVEQIRNGTIITNPKSNRWWLTSTHYKYTLHTHTRSSAQKEIFTTAHLVRLHATFFSLSVMCA